MEHLTDDEIIDFVMTEKPDEESEKKSSSVIRHIVKCNECLKRVQAFQIIYDELAGIALDNELREALETYKESQELFTEDYL